MTTAVVRMSDVTKRYGDVTALDGVSFELAENMIHGLLGRNGAGKSTIMQILSAQRFETTGTVEVFGERPYENASVLARMCFIGESQRYPDAFKIKHALKAAQLLYPNWDDAFADRLMRDFGLAENRTIKKLSRGMLSAVGVIIGLASRAPLTFFDEPYLGLDAVARQLFYDRLLADYAEHPRTVLLSTHLIDEVSDLLEHVILIDRGRIRLDADAESLRGRAITATGPVDAVDAYVAGQEVLHSERLGGFARVTIDGRPDRPPIGVELEPVSLQTLVIRTTQRESSSPEGQDLAHAAERGNR